MTITIRTMNLIKPAVGGTERALDPVNKPTFDAVEPFGYTQTAMRCILVDGRWFPLATGYPEDGLDEWDASDAEARELALDEAVASIDAMPAPVRAMLRERLQAADHKPYPVRKAKRALDDAEAEVRALEARGAKGAELAQARSKADEKRAALDEARRRKP